jgi:hypothetical protein
VALGFLNWFLGPVGRYVGLALLALAVAGWLKYDIAKDAVQAFKAKLFTQEAARVKNATDADDVAKRCALDPGCRLQDDGWRRD